MKIKDLTSFLEKKFPLDFQESYDNSGSQVLFPEASLKGIMFSLDLSNEILTEALKKKCNLIITHHPFFFNPLRKIILSDPQSQIISKLLEKKVSVYALHTNLDKFYYNKLGEIYSGKENELLFPTNDTLEGEKIGFGTVVKLEKALSLNRILALTKERLKIDFVIYAGDLKQSIKTLAVLNGAGGGAIEKIISLDQKIEAILTGDVNYHQAQAALLKGVAVIDAGHYNTEKILLDFLKKEIDYFLKKNSQKEIKLYLSKKETNPFQVY